MVEFLPLLVVPLVLWSLSLYTAAIVSAFVFAVDYGFLLSLIGVVVSLGCRKTVQEVPPTVVLLHGCGVSGWSMWCLSRYLTRHGFNSHIVSYPSKSGSLESLAAGIYDKLERLEVLHGAELYFVGHSMGGIMLRLLMNRLPQKPVRCVMLGTPNLGAGMVTLIVKYLGICGRWWIGEACCQLEPSDDAMKALRRMHPMPTSVGIIAGSVALSPIVPFVGLTPNDGQVEVHNTVLGLMKEHIVVRCSHSLFSTNYYVMVLVLSFLTTGSFITQNEYRGPNLVEDHSEELSSSPLQGCPELTTLDSVRSKVVDESDVKCSI